MRRGRPEGVVALLLVLLLGSYVWYTRTVMKDMGESAAHLTRMYARIYHGLGAPGEEAQALLGLSQSVREQGLPIIQTDLKGNPGAHANLPFDRADTVSNTDPR